MIGKELADFRITGELAEGGMGKVFRGVTLTESHPVAIKVLHEELGKQREEVGRFIREAIIYKRLRHPNLIRFYHFGFEQDLGFYLVTELLDGRELEEAIAEQGPNIPFSLSHALDISLQICAGLATAHSEGIIHRDLKPANVFMARQADGSEVAKIFDFGIGKLLEQQTDPSQQNITGMTQHGIALGTPLYMSPEQIRGDLDNVGKGTDIYALGIMIFQLITGHLPYTGDNPMEILKGHLINDVPLLRKHQRFLSGSELEELVHAMMHKDYIDRPSNIEDIREALWRARQNFAPSETSTTMMELPSFGELQDIFKHQMLDTQEFHSNQPTPPPPSTTRDNPIAVLLHKQGESENEVGWLIPGEHLRIGSGSHVGVRIRDKSLASEHAEVFTSPQGWISIKSFNSAPVRVNGAQVHSMVLNNGDWLTLGDVMLRLHCFD